MAYQLPDMVRRERRSFDLAGQSAGPPFDPTVYGIRPIFANSRINRGLTCDYDIVNGRLEVVRVQFVTRHATSRIGNNHAISNQRDDGAFQVEYDELNLPLAYTGGLLLGSFIIERLIVPFGIQPAWKYREVHELQFIEGSLVEEWDRSADVAQLRDSLADKVRDLWFDEDARHWHRNCFNEEYPWRAW